MREQKKIYKWFWVWEFEKEESWLNEMASEGWVLADVGFGRFTFEKYDAASYIIRIEMRDYNEQYVSFMRETGAEYIGQVVQWLYFRRKSEYGQFDIYSDMDSKIAQLERLGKLLATIGAANLVLGVMNSINASRSGWVNLVCACLLMYGLGRIHGKKEALEKERTLRE